MNIQTFQQHQNPAEVINLSQRISAPVTTDDILAAEMQMNFSLDTVPVDDKEIANDEREEDFFAANNDEVTGDNRVRVGMRRSIRVMNSTTLQRNYAAMEAGIADDAFCVPEFDRCKELSWWIYFVSKEQVS